MAEVLASSATYFSFYVVFRLLRERCAQVFGTLVLVYALSSIDLIPDFIPFFGLISDIVVLPLGLYISSLLAGKDVMGDARSSADDDQPFDLFGAVFTLFLVIAIISWFSHLLYHILGPK